MPTFRYLSLSLVHIHKKISSFADKILVSLCHYLNMFIFKLSEPFLSLQNAFLVFRKHLNSLTFYKFMAFLMLRGFLHILTSLKMKKNAVKPSSASGVSSGKKYMTELNFSTYLSSTTGCKFHLNEQSHVVRTLIV